MKARPRIGLVLSAGGLRGAAHLGVLRRLRQQDIPIHVIVGVSAGAVVAAYYAAAGLTIDELIDDARVFQGRHLVAHSLNIRSRRWLEPLFAPFCGIVLRRLEQLEDGRFDRLHHGVEAIGIVCHDLTNDRPRYFSTGADGGVRLYDAVATSASIPSMFPPRPVTLDGQICQLTDGGVSDGLPVDFARGPTLAATHLIVSDCRRRGVPLADTDRLIYVRPQLDGTTTLRAPRASLFTAVTAGETVVTDDVIARARRWVEA
jgi:NTE family protein